jgi:hypothetical protein
VFKENIKGGGAMALVDKGILYELYDYPFTYLLYRPSDRRAVVLVEDGEYAMKSRNPKLRLLNELAILTVLPFWIYPNTQLLERARQVEVIDTATTERMFKFAEEYPLYEVDEYTYNKMRELAEENLVGMLEIVEEAECAYTE